MRQLFHRRPGRIAERRTIGASLVIAGALVTLAPPHASGEPRPVSVAITSPLGRSGLPGTVRIVARITTPEGSPAVPAVRFYVNGALVATDTDGPPYVAEWQDENPFLPCTLAVETDDALGMPVRDTVELMPLTISDESDVTSVGVDAAVQDGGGRYVAGLDASQFVLREDGEPQTIDLVTVGCAGRDLHAADRQQPEHVPERPIRATGGR